MTSVILLAGGVGKRLGSSIPKQYLDLNQKPIALYSFEIFQNSPLIQEIVVVCEPEYEPLFPPNTLFARPGYRRQDSVYQGLLKTKGELVLAHDSARPFIQSAYLAPLIDAAKRTGAAALAVQVTSTIKQCGSDRIAIRTLDRSTLWEMQTPQAVQRALFFEAFEYVNAKNLEVTDELSMIEALGKPTEIVPSCPSNFKITTPFDLKVAETLCATK